MWFLQVMRKVLSDGKEFLTKEVERVKKIQEGKITKEKKERERVTLHQSPLLHRPPCMTFTRTSPP